MRTKEPLRARIARWSLPQPSGCIVWIGQKSRDGYGRLKSGSINLQAHRAAYELLKGPIPDGLDLDHLCRNRACCNPDHLEPVSRRENTLRGEGRAAVQARQTHCVHGHPFNAANTYYEGRKRRCRACGVLRVAAYKRRLRLAAA